MRLRNPLRIKGYEKFWLALLAGNSVQVPILLTLAAIGALVKDGSAYIPTPEAVITVVGIFWGTWWAAFGAFIGYNTPLDANGDPLPSAPVPAPSPPAAAPELPVGGMPPAQPAGEAGPEIITTTVTRRKEPAE